MTKKLEEIELDDLNTPLVEVPKPEIPQRGTRKAQRITSEITDDALVSCLRNERVIVRYIPKASGIWGTNPKHILAGGMAERAVRTFVVPKLTSGMFVNILTNKEKAFLEDVMGLEYDALSIYRKVDNFWDDSNENGINRVRLSKQDNYLNLANPEDYIKYKILLANKDYIAPSVQALQDTPKATYQFVIVSEGEETKMAKSNMSATMMCYKEFGKVENDFDTLKLIVETLSGKPIAKSTKIEFLQTKANELIQTDSKLFLKVIMDPLLSTKVLIKKSVEAGLISNRGNYLYLRSDNTPLCEPNEEPTMNTAAKYLNAPKHQELLFTLQAKLK